jgi:deoxyribose-phosphate aldolase
MAEPHSSVQALAELIDQTLLSPTVGLVEARTWIEENAGRGFAALCVAPLFAATAARLLDGSATRVCSVCGFPLGYSLTTTKADEARELVSLGCAEVDMVMSLGELIGGDTDYVGGDIRAVVQAVRDESGGQGIVKVILETGHLTEDQVETACRVAEAAGADFVKTSTGFGPRGASVRDVELMHAAIGGRLGIKAAGGIRDLDAALALIDAGATRLGTSSGGRLLDELAARQA